MLNVTQILGRVLRQPYARSTMDSRLNLSYVLSSSIDFHSTIDEIIRGLNSVGFGKEDIAFENLDDTVQTALSPEMTTMALEFGHILPVTQSPHTLDSPEDFDATHISLTGNDEITEKMLEHAVLQDKHFMEEVNSFGETYIARELRENMNIYTVKPSFRELIKTIKIPQFFPRENTQLTIIDDPVPLDREELSTGFTLSTADANITLE